jgi:L-fuculose-phosphate aldolase
MSAPARVRKEVSEYSTLLWKMGWVANHDGNVSAKSGEGDRFAITPTATSKRLCPPDSIVECDLSGKPVSRGKPPSEVAMHVGAYKARKEIRAVIHAHPPYASAFALARVELGAVFMPEVVVSLGESIPLVPLLLPKDPATAEAIAAALSISDAALLAGNGAITVGVDLEQAYLRMELLEHYAKILSTARASGLTPAPLDAGQKEKLLEMRRAAGLLVSPKSGAAEKEPNNVRRIVTEEVRRALGASK